MIKRKQDYLAQLVEFTNTEAGKLFLWGETNCVALALRALDAQCGSDLISIGREFMATERAALVWVGRNGGANGLFDLLIREHGLEQVFSGFVSDGDIALKQGDNTINAYVFVSGYWLSSTADLGVKLFRTDAVDLSNAYYLGVRECQQW
jgi:hypothetical protein